MRAIALFFLLCASVATAQEAHAVDPAPVVGSKVWGELPPWRQRMVLVRYRRYLALPARRRAAIEARGLARYLLEPARRPEVSDLPKGLRREIGTLPVRLRPIAARAVLIRWRQLLLDRALRAIPDRSERWEVFERLYPEPFDAQEARKASRELKERVLSRLVTEARKALAGEEHRLGRPLTPAERKQFADAFLSEKTHAQDAEIARRIGIEMLRAAERVRDPKRLVALFQRETGDFGAAGAGLATPREQVLLRWALHPEECPLLEPAKLGDPEAKGLDPDEARRRRKDFRVLARLELLAETRLPRGIVLHLADSGSAIEMLRAFRRIRAGESAPQ